jgi:thiol-disulfide isomerase/thioredoxin
MNTSPLSQRLTFVIALALVLARVSDSAVAAELKAGETFPDLAQFELEGKLPESLRDKVVLVDFWASWCGPCKASFPAMVELHKQYAARGLVILAVSVDEKKAAMDEFLAKHPVSFTVVRDARQKLIARVDASNVPTSFILDGKGRVHWVHNGFRGSETLKEYRREIEHLLTLAPGK